MRTYNNMRSLLIGDSILFKKKGLGKNTFLKIFLNIYSNPAKKTTGAAVRLSLFKGAKASKPFSSVFIDPDELDEFISFLEDALLIFGEYNKKVTEPSLNEAQFQGKRFLNGHVSLMPKGNDKFMCEGYLTFSGGSISLSPKKHVEVFEKLMATLKEEQTYQKMKSYEAVGA